MKKDIEKAIRHHIDGTFSNELVAFCMVEIHKMYDYDLDIEMEALLHTRISIEMDDLNDEIYFILER